MGQWNVAWPVKRNADTMGQVECLPNRKHKSERMSGQVELSKRQLLRHRLCFLFHVMFFNFIFDFISGAN